MTARYVSKLDITRGVRIVDIAEEYGIPIEPASSGNFDCRCTCPSSEHKNGNERTGSCYIDSKNNNFYCFGCNTGSNSIDFYMMCAEVDFGTAMSELKSRVKPGGNRTRRYNVEANNFPILIQISTLFRKTMLRHTDDLKWINQLMKDSDPHILDIKSNDVKKAKKLHDYIEGLIKRRYKKK
jgi:DNA primase